MTSPTTSPAAPPASVSPVEALEREVAAIFRGTVATVWVDPLHPAIPEALRYDSSSPAPGQRRWRPPEKILGIKCGNESQKLGAIVFKNQDALERFTRCNPELNNSLVTWWPHSSCVLWLRPLDYRVESRGFEQCSWVWNGVVPVSALTLKPRHFVLLDAPIASVKMYSVAWPKQMQQHLHMLIFEEAFGPRYHQSGSRKRILNPMVWANFLAKEMGLAYEVEGEIFSVPTENGDGFEAISIEKLMTKTAHLLHLAAQRDPANFPIGEIKALRIRKLIEEMKIAVGFHTSGEQDAWGAFLADCVESRTGTDLTVAEFYHHYADYCRAKALPRLPQSIFERKLPGLVRVMFGVAKSHDLKRTAGDGALRWHRGFRGLALKVGTDGAKATDGSDAPDGSDGLPKNPEVALGVAAHQNQPKDTIPTHSGVKNVPKSQAPT